RLDVGLVTGRDVHPGLLLLLDPARALLEVRLVGLVGTHLLRRHDPIEVDAAVAPRRTEQLVVDVRQDPDLVLLGEALELGVRLAERSPIGHAVGQELSARGLELPPELLGSADGRAPQNLRVELVRTALHLVLDLGEQGDQLVPVDRETVAVGLLLESVVRAGLPVDQGAVAVKSDELDFAWKGHASAASYVD